MEKSTESNKKETYSLQKEIYTLRKGKGLSTLKIERLSLLPLIIATSIGIPRQNTSTDQLQTYLIHKIDSLPGELEVAALRNALGLGWKVPDTLATRCLLAS